MNLIVAVDQNWGIGYENQLLAHISADLKRFKALTLGHTVILGRNTLETFPGKRPLPGRKNVIMSTNHTYAPEGAQVCHSVEEVLQQAEDDSYVIGGARVYRALLPYCHTAYVTKIGKAFPADCFFPNLDQDAQWQVQAEEVPAERGELPFYYVTYQRSGKPCI